MHPTLAKLLLFGSSPTIVQSGLVAEYRFDEGSGQVLTDYKNGYNGQLGSTAGSDTNDPTWDAQGLNFTTDDYVYCGNNAALLPDAFTLEIIGKFTGANIPVVAWNTTSTPSVMAKLTGDGLPLLYMGGENFRYFGNNVDIADNSPHHLIATMPGNGQNDILSSSMIADGIPLTPSAPYTVAGQTGKVGLYLGRASGYMEGSLYIVNLYNRVLTAGEQAQNRAYYKSKLAARGIVLP